VTEVDIKGAEQLASLSRQLKAAGDKALARELTKAISKAVAPLKSELPASARSHLPKRGGLAERVAASKVGFSRRTSGQAVGLRVQAKNAYHLAQMDAGFVRHPVFKRKGEEGRRVVWQTQRITPGWFSKPTEAAGPRIRAEVQAAMDVVAKQIEGKG
jgi:hypothetical protein